MTASVNVNNVLATLPEYGMGIHTSVYDNSLRTRARTPTICWTAGSTTPASTCCAIRAAVTPTSSISPIPRPTIGFWQRLRPVALVGAGGNNYGYMGANTDFGNFVKLLDATNSKTVITLNTGSAMKYDSANEARRSDPQRSAARGRGLGRLCQCRRGNLRHARTTSTSASTPKGTTGRRPAIGPSSAHRRPAEFQTWATTDGVYNSQNAFLAIDRDEPVGIKYWEIGNETFGTGYYGGTAIRPATP